MADHLEKWVDSLYVKEVVELAEKIAKHFSTKTKWILVPQKTTRWRIETFTDPEVITVIVPLVDFLGTHIGYSDELDVLIIAKEDKK